jgi:hypothetical protein
MHMHSTLKRGVSAAAVLSALTGGIVALSASPAAAFDAGNLASITSPTGTATGSNLDYPVMTAPAPCDVAATRHVAKVTSVVATNPAQQTLADAWAGDNLYAPVGVGLPGPLSVQASNTWQGLADASGQTIVPGKWNLELRCQNNLGTTLYQQWKGSVTFSSATAWTVDAAAKAATTASVAVTPQPVTAGQPITYTATIAESNAATATGNVSFAVDGGAAQTASLDASGVATLVGTAPAGGSHTVAVSYAGDAVFDGSTASQAFTTVAAPASATSTSLSASPLTGPAYQTVTLTGAVANTTTPANVPVGACDFFDGATKVATVPVSATGACAYSSAAFGAGAHDFSASFTPTSAALFVASSSAHLAATYDAPQATPDEQTIVVTVPVGNLSINTPYTPQNPLNLGDMVLALNGSSYSASAVFDKVTITDTRAGNPGWAASLLRADFVGADGVIPAKYSGFEGVTPSYFTGNAVQAITVTPVPANDPAYVAGPVQFAGAAAGQGTGSVEVKGNFVLKGVPTSTKPGLYTSTVTFTVG